MTAVRSPFEQTVMITAAVRHLAEDNARTALVIESLAWIDANLPGAEHRVAFAAAITAASEAIDANGLAQTDRDTGNRLRTAAACLASQARYTHTRATNPNAPF